MDLIPEPAPNLRQLLAFYLEAGVDCALQIFPPASTELVDESTPAERYLRITELMYHPAADEVWRGFAADDFEFIELRNTSTGTPIPLSTVQLSAGIEFDFATSPIPSGSSA